MRLRDETGFTLIELCTVMVIVSILLRVGLPAYQSIITKARATQAIGDINVIREASVAYYAAQGSWPVESAATVIPNGLATYLPKGYTFARSKYQLDWENWSLPSGLPSNPKSGVLLGVSVVTTDTKLGNAVLQLISKASPSLTSADHYTMLLVSATDGL